jgi:hypothetical protein
MTVETMAAISARGAAGSQRRLRRWRPLPRTIAENSEGAFALSQYIISGAPTAIAARFCSALSLILKIFIGVSREHFEQSRIGSAWWSIGAITASIVLQT